ncbi:MAG: dehydrogenase [Planctomycetaceae bacterium]|nr:dehydrogenase [Planctomycetaceae bacterium]
MSSSDRRTFLKVAGAASATTLFSAPAVQAQGANERVTVATIGCGGQGSAHVRSLLGLKDARLAYVCDVDKGRLAKAAATAPDAKAVTDLRRVLDDKNVDAVTIATPDHWHATAGLLALEAGKHVYVEKPCSHNVREGRLLLDKARAKNLKVQHGTQSRSSQGIANAVQMLRDGIIGDVFVAKSWNWQRRANIGRAQPATPPETLNYDMWVGPAEYVPYQSNRLHYNWHWWYNFGCGGIGNDGIHDLDYAMWGLGVDTHPSTVSGMGSKFFFDDDQEFPDTQQVTFEYPGNGQTGKRRMLVYEQRLWSTTYPHNVDSGAEFYGTKGMMFLSKRGKITIRGERNREIKDRPEGRIGGSVSNHQQNWIDCIRSGKTPRADIEIAHRTATVVHLGNIGARVGKTLEFDAKNERITNDQAADKMLSREYREGHWAAPDA